MRRIYIECKMGAAGDMLMAALYELLNDKEQSFFLKKMNSIFDKLIFLSANSISKCNINGTHMNVEINGYGSENHTHSHVLHHEHNIENTNEAKITQHSHHSHEHYSYQNIIDKISTLDLDEKTKFISTQIYKCIGEAEAKVHNSTIENIHFHEVGSLDALCDVVGCSLLINMLNINEVIVSPIHVGNGYVKCAHGTLPVPAPATAEILKDIPYYTGQIQSELCTPTGAAIIKIIANRFDSMPIMNISKIGIGMGTKDFDIINCVRIFLEDTSKISNHKFEINRSTDAINKEINIDFNNNDDSNYIDNNYIDRNNISVNINDNDKVNDSDLYDTIMELSCNIDDMTGEELSYAMEILFDNGALDVFFTNIQMKKNRPGILLTCICTIAEKEKFENIIFKHTTTRGIRECVKKRIKLSYSFSEINTKFGTINLKTSSGHGICKKKYEFDSIKKVAKDNNLSLFDAKKIIPE